MFMRTVIVGAALALATPAVQPALAKNCPPGLAKKNPPCVPPGQAKKGYWSPGDYVGDEEVHWITLPDRYGLPPLAPGRRYMILGNQIYVVDDSTYTILSVLQAVGAILD